jgi:small subunit ribosomal protein S6
LKDYELVYILPPTVEEEQTAGVVEAVSNFVQTLKGEVQEVKPWGRRKLAFPIQHHREGSYVEMHFKLDPAASSDLERGLRLNESVLRYMLVRKDQR